MTGTDIERVDLVDGVVEDDPACSVAGSLELVGELGNALSVVAYGAADHGQRLLNVVKWIGDTHRPRDGSDPRCSVCYTAAGQPEPWPCLTWREVSAAAGVKPNRPADEAALLAAGAANNHARTDKGSALDELMLTLARLFGERPERWLQADTLSARVMTDRDLLMRARLQLEAVRPGLVARVREILAARARRGTGVRR